MIIVTIYLLLLFSKNIVIIEQQISPSLVSYLLTMRMNLCSLNALTTKPASDFRLTDDFLLRSL